MEALLRLGASRDATDMDGKSVVDYSVTAALGSSKSSVVRIREILQADRSGPVARDPGARDDPEDDLDLD